MTAEKGNKVYIIGDAEKASYEAQGFDIKDEDGEVIASGKGKTVAYEDYAVLMRSHLDLTQLYTELEKTHEELAMAYEKVAGKKQNEDEFSPMSIEELKVYAMEHQIDIGASTSQKGIADKIRAAIKVGE